eukprot:TRINITY_DN21679_c0_g1_i1.p1 TRINITY_DN21679_c0_g1~~TRINITY_DN21679_c0_g1_i1.p1  ORF type:complete len:519 (+),score=119.25 TRINITY_DN21679_c0_g1_i1:64-1620(+)
MLAACLTTVFCLASWGTPTRDYHYSVQVKGTVAGLMRMRMYKKKNDNDEVIYRSVEDMVAEVERGVNDLVKLEFTTFIEEREDGSVVSSGYSQKMAQTVIEMEYDYETKPGKVVVKSTQSGAVHNSEVDAPKKGTYYGRLAMLKKLHENFKNGETEFDINTIKPEMGPTTVTMRTKLLGTDDEVVDTPEHKNKVATNKYSTLVVGVGIQSTEWYILDSSDDTFPSYIMTKYSVDSAMGKLEALYTTEENAKKAYEGTDVRPELVHSAYVPLKRPSRKMYTDSGAITYKVTAKAGDVPDFPANGFQTVEVKGDHALVTIDLGKPELFTGDAEEQRTYLQPTAMIDGTDPGVMKLAAKARELAGEDADTNRLARAAWRITKDTIKRSDLATGFASATETAKTMTGDCSEYAVLLAGILRALDIPSRTCSGLVYLEDSKGANFGWHMWSQALLPGKCPDDECEDEDVGALYWNDMDGTLPIPFSLGHILFGVSAMSDSEAHTAELKLVSMIGNIEVEIIDP